MMGNGVNKKEEILNKKVKSINTGELLIKARELLARTTFFLKRKSRLKKLITDFEEQGKLFSYCQYYLDKAYLLKADILLTLNFLEKAEMELSAYLKERFKEELSSMKANEKRSFIENKLLEIYLKQEDCKTALKLLECVINNLTSTYWNLSKMKDLGDLLLSLERKVP